MAIHTLKSVSEKAISISFGNITSPFGTFGKSIGRLEDLSDSYALNLDLESSRKGYPYFNNKRILRKRKKDLIDVSYKNRNSFLKIHKKGFRFTQW